ncbi:MAG: hypothetical protein JO257_35950 [Deltaproteobacteria bacterium]|nr:hypothetical protein [Deltaproteobacteria bacterium]
MRLPTLFIAVAAVSQMGNTDCGQVIRDSGFDLWCGDQLCAWKLERGDIKRVPTWNEGDSGVELDGADVAIEQLTPVDSGDGTCIEFSLVANVDKNADVELNVDIYGDGSIEHHERLPTANWKPLSYDLAIKGPYRGIRFELAKTGSGKAQLANIGAKTIDQQSCSGLTPIIAGPAPEGAYCDTNNQASCASGICSLVPDTFDWFGVTAACSQCDDTHACTGNEVCGLHEPTSPVFWSSNGCVAPAAKEFGERCNVNAECASNQCTGGRCSYCPGACSCTPVWFGGPSLCNAGRHLGASGSPCGTDDDCASAACDGTVRKECEDGRPCATALDCPFGIGSAAPLQNGACITVGVQGGTCR